MGTADWLLRTEKPIFFYRVHVDNLILPSQGDIKNSEFDNSQVCNRHDAAVQEEAMSSSVTAGDAQTSVLILIYFPIDKRAK